MSTLRKIKSHKKTYEVYRKYAYVVLKKAWKKYQEVLAGWHINSLHLHYSYL